MTHNSADDLQRFWGGRPRPSWVEWVVVDNGSTDGSAGAALALGADKIIPLDENVGFSSANNVGWWTATAGNILFANPDVEVSYDELPTLASHLERHRCLVAPQLRNEDNTRQPNGRGLPSLWSKLANRLTAEGPTGYRLYAGVGQIRPVAWVMGAAIAARRETLERISGWDERFFLYYEDADICLRAWRFGIPSCVHGDVSWRHGWARETMRFRWLPWKREVASMVLFYLRYPRLLLPRRLAGKGYWAAEQIAAEPNVGRSVT